jgi:predicted kinase
VWFIALKGLAGSGKSTLGRALGQRLGWPIIDKDDIKDLLDGHTPEAGMLAYATMLRIARRQLLLGLDVIADSPLTFSALYAEARRIAAETHASLVIIECFCSDEQPNGNGASMRARSSICPGTIRQIGQHSRLLAQNGCIHRIIACKILT